LFLLRFVCGARVLAAHLDHGMRANSGADAQWVAGLCRAWAIPLVTARCREAPHGEDAARRERYAFLHSAARVVQADRVVLGHHADDQAETVLFRVLRGTGVPGLAGMAPLGPGLLARPLLPFWRRDVACYARARQLRWRNDASNRELGYARNRIRLDLIPRIERTIAPAARAGLVRLAELARENEILVKQAVGGVTSEAIRTDGEAVILSRAVFRQNPVLAPLLLRHALRNFGPAPGRVGTRMAVSFITDSPSGREFLLPGGVSLLAEFDEVRIRRSGVAAAPDRPLCLDGTAGTGMARIGGREYRVAWEIGTWLGDAPDRVGLHPKQLCMPLLVRGPAPGDRVRLSGGSRPLKKLWGDRRVPRSRRAATPVLADAVGRTLWVAGVARTVEFQPQHGEDALLIHISDA